MRELRVSYFSDDQSWGKTKGIDRAPQNAGEHIGPGLSAQSLRHCLNCHTTWFRSAELNGPRLETARDARSRHRLRTMPRAGTKPRQGRPDGFRRAGHRPDEVELRFFHG